MFLSLALEITRCPSRASRTGLNSNIPLRFIYAFYARDRERGKFMQRKKLDREAILVALDDFKADFPGKGNSLLSWLLLSLAIFIQVSIVLRYYANSMVASPDLTRHVADVV